MKKSMIAVSVLSASLLFVGCGGSSDSDGGGISVNDAEPIVTIDDAKKAAQGLSSVSSMQTMLPTSSTSSYYVVQRVSTFASTAARKATPSQSYECPAGGTIIIQTTSSASMTQVYDSCAMVEGYTLDGSVNVSNMDQSNNSFSATMSYNGFRVSGSDFSATMDMTIDMQVDYSDSYSNVSSSMKYNGKLSLVAGDTSASYEYANLRTTSSVTSSSIQSTIDGLISVDSPCYSGVLDIETVEPLTMYNTYDYLYRGGELKVNEATYSYNSDGTVTITTATGESSTLDQYDLASACID